MPVDVDAYLGELRDRGLLPDDPLCVFLGGSIIRGWENAASDLDLYIVSDDRWTGESVEFAAVGVEPDTVPVNAFYVGERRWDVEYWQSKQIDDLLNKVSWQAYDNGMLASHAFRPRDIDLMERLLYAEPLAGMAWIKERQQVLNDSALITYLVSHRLNLSDIFVEDAVGQLRAGDTECAVLSARMAFGHAVDALLASHGEFGQSAKWRPRRFHAITQDILSFEDYWRLETMASYDARRPSAWVEEVLETCQRIALGVTR